MSCFSFCEKHCYYKKRKVNVTHCIKYYLVKVFGAKEFLLRITPAAWMLTPQGKIGFISETREKKGDRVGKGVVRAAGRLVTYAFVPHVGAWQLVLTPQGQVYDRVHFRNSSVRKWG